MAHTFLFYEYEEDWICERGLNKKERIENLLSPDECIQNSLWFYISLKVLCTYIDKQWNTSLHGMICIVILTYL